MIELRRINFNTFDLFQGKGWDKHTRIRKGKAGVYVIGGYRLPKGMLRDLDHVLYPNFPVTPGMSLEQTVFNLSQINRD